MRRRSIRLLALLAMLGLAAPAEHRSLADDPAAAPAAEPTPASARTPAEIELDGVRERLLARSRSFAPGEAEALARTLVDASHRYELPVELVLAVIEVESSFDPFAVSGVGARGLMQLMPATAAEVAHRVGIAWRGPRTLFDPAVNVQLGVAYLRSLVDRYASVRVALAAYNWGPGRIDSRLNDGKSLPALYSRRVLETYSNRRLERIDS